MVGYILHKSMALKEDKFYSFLNKSTVNMNIMQRLTSLLTAVLNQWIIVQLYMTSSVIYFIEGKIDKNYHYLLCCHHAHCLNFNQLLSYIHKPSQNLPRQFSEIFYCH